MSHFTNITYKSYIQYRIQLSNQFLYNDTKQHYFVNSKSFKSFQKLYYRYTIDSSITIKKDIKSFYQQRFDI